MRLCRAFINGAAQESNLPTVGLPRPAGFEDGASLALGARLRVVSDRLSDRRCQSHCALTHSPTGRRRTLIAWRPVRNVARTARRASGFAERAALR